MNSTRENTRCCYREHICSRTRFENYNFCFEHMLVDENSPFTSCEYISRTSNRKCPNPALRQRKSDDIPVFCNDHFQELIAKERHHKQKKRMRKKKKSEKRISEQKIRKERKGLINHVLKRGNGMPSSSQRSNAIDSSDSDVYEEVHRPITDDWPLESLEDLKNDANWDDFDPVNNEVYEPLRYADVLTPEEVVATAQSKLIRLQSLYLEQFKRLFYVLKERRRDYLHEQKKEEKEEKSGKAGSSNMESDPAHHRKMMALFNYRKRKGVEILLRRKQKKKRMETGSGSSNYPPEQAASQQRCAHASNHARCKSSCLPYTKYCSEHILEDPHQLLYRKCCMNNCQIAVCHLTSRPYKEKIEGDIEKKILGGQTEDKCYCMLHAPLPEMTFKMPKEILKGYEPKMEVETSTDVSQPTEIEQETKMDVDSLPSEGNMQISENPSICKPEAVKEQAPSSQDSESLPALPQQAKEELVETTQDDTAIGDVGPNISASSQLKLDARDTEPEQEVTKMDVNEKQSVEQSSEAKLNENTDVSVQSEITVTAPKESIVEKISEELKESEPSLQLEPLVDKKDEDNVFAEKEQSLPCKPSAEEKLECKAHPEPSGAVGEDNKPELLGNIHTNVNDASNAETEGMNDSNISKRNEDCQSVENADKEENQDNVESKSSNLEGDVLPNTNNNSSKDADIESDIIPEENSDKIKTNNEPANDNLKTEAEEENVEGKVPEESHSVLESDDSTWDILDSELGKDESEDATEQTCLTPSAPVLEQMTSRMGERKPSSADEEMAVVSLLSLCSASHHSDENFSSSAEQEELQL